MPRSITPGHNATRTQGITSYQKASNFRAKFSNILIHKNKIHNCSLGRLLTCGCDNCNIPISMNEHKLTTIHRLNLMLNRGRGGNQATDIQNLVQSDTRD